MLKRSRDQSECGSGEEGDDAVQASRESSVKMVQVDNNDTTADVGESNTHTCYLAPHEYGVTFDSYREYDAHYRLFHMHQCSECHKNFPSVRLLDLHIAEYHDPIVDAKRDRGDAVYACFVEGCDKVCRQPIRRRWHLIAKHNFPENYNFGVVTHGLGNRHSMLRDSRRARHHHGQSRAASSPSASQASPGNLSKQTTNTSESSASAADHMGTAPANRKDADHTKDVETLTDSMASLKFVPRAVKFGRGGQRGGFARQ